MRVGLLAVLLAAVSSGCATRQPLPVVEEHEQVNLSDGEFAHLMATHHRAVMDVALVGTKAKSPLVQARATAIWEARRRELPALDELKKQAPQLSEVAASHERELIAGHRASMTRLKAAKPSELDALFVDEMQRRIEMAFEMIAQARLQDPHTAEQLAETHRAELKQLNQLQQANAAR